MKQLAGKYSPVLIYFQTLLTLVKKVLIIMLLNSPTILAPINNISKHDFNKKITGCEDTSKHYFIIIIIYL